MSMAMSAGVSGLSGNRSLLEKCKDGSDIGDNTNPADAEADAGLEETLAEWKFVAAL